jgi:hypothetical protein
MSYESAPATKMLATQCACCGRPLVDAASIEAGMGPICRKQHGYAAAQVAPDWKSVLSETDGALSVSEILGFRHEAATELNLLEASWLLGGLETRRVANALVHRIAVDQDGPQVLQLTNAIRALGFTKLADRIAHRLAKIVITVEGDALFVEAPFSDAKVEAFRKVPGRSRDKDRGRYGADRFPLTSKRSLFTALKSAFPGATAVGPKGLFTINSDHA